MAFVSLADVDLKIQDSLGICFIVRWLTPVLGIVYTKHLNVVTTGFNKILSEGSIYKCWHWWSLFSWWPILNCSQDLMDLNRGNLLKSERDRVWGSISYAKCREYFLLLSPALTLFFLMKQLLQYPLFNRNSYQIKLLPWLLVHLECLA